MQHRAPIANDGPSNRRESGSSRSMTGGAFAVLSPLFLPQGSYHSCGRRSSRVVVPIHFSSIPRMRLGLSLGLRWTCPRHGQETFLRANLRSREYPRANSVIPMTDQRCAEFEDAKRKREGREADEEHAHVGQPLPSAQVEDLLEDLLAVSDHQGDEDEKRDGSDEELEGELGIVVVERKEKPDLVADETRPDAEDDRVHPSELYDVVHDAQPTGDPHHGEPVPEMVEVDSLGDDHETRECEVEEPRAEEAAQECEGRQERKSVLESSSLRKREHGPPHRKDMWIRRIVAPTYTMPRPTAIIAPPEASDACIIGSTRPSMARPAASIRTPYTIIKKPSLRRRGVLRIPTICRVLPRTTPPRRRSRIAPTEPQVTPIPVSVEAIGEFARIKRPTTRSRAPPAIPRTMETVLGVRPAADVSGCMVSSLQRFPEERQAHVVPVVDVRVRVLELFVHVADPAVEELPVQRARPPDQVELVLRSAVDVHEPQETEPRTVPIDHVHRIPRPPALPDVGTPLPGLEVERKVDSHFLASRIRRIVRRHADRVQDRGHLLSPPVRLLPVPAEPFRGASAPPKRGEGFREIHDVAEFEEGVPGMVGQRRPGIGM